MKVEIQDVTARMKTKCKCCDKIPSPRRVKMTFGNNYNSFGESLYFCNSNCMYLYFNSKIYEAEEAKV